MKSWLEDMAAVHAVLGHREDRESGDGGHCYV